MKKIILILALLQVQLVWSSSARVAEIFNQRFYSSYEAGRCGDNILGFARELQYQNIDLRNASIIEIINTGFSVAGLINAVYAREAGSMNPNFPQEGLRRLPGSKNWYHHVILLLDNQVFDFDFGNTPKFLSVKQYFEKMFLSDARPKDSYFTVTREEKLKDYKLTIRPALQTIRAYDNQGRLPKTHELILEDFLKNL